MISRILFLAVCLFTSSLQAITVEDGDYYASLLAHEDVLMTGGTVDFLYLGENVAATIEGGVVGGPNLGIGITIELWSDNELTIRGGDLQPLGLTPPSQPINPAVVYCDRGNSTLIVQGTYFRIKDYGLDVGNGWDIQGWLADGSFTNFKLVHEQFREQATIIVDLVPGVIPLTPGDTNYDDVVDLHDVNNVRNNFGGNGLGDANQDGQVDIDDLSLVRGNFARGPWFTIPPEFEVGESEIVPEPPAFALAGLLILAVLVARRQVHAIR